MRRLPPLNALRVFDASARKGSFAAAGDELSVTASAVSHQIKTLEEYLGVRLFSRSKRKVELTPSGEQYLMSVKHALDEIEMATHRLADNQVSGVNYLVRSATTMMAGWVVLLFTFSSLLKLLLSSVAFPL